MPLPTAADVERIHQAAHAEGLAEGRAVPPRSWRKSAPPRHGDARDPDLGEKIADDIVSLALEIARRWCASRWRCGAKRSWRSCATPCSRCRSSGFGAADAAPVRSGDCARTGRPAHAARLAADREWGDRARRLPHERRNARRCRPATRWERAVARSGAIAPSSSEAPAPNPRRQGSRMSAPAERHRWSLTSIAAPGWSQATSPFRICGHLTRRRVWSWKRRAAASGRRRLQHRAAQRTQRRRGGRGVFRRPPLPDGDRGRLRARAGRHGLPGRTTRAAPRLRSGDAFSPRR